MAAVIVKQPDSISMSGNLSPLIVQTSEALPVFLTVGGEILLSETYYPGDGNLVEVDFRDVVESCLAFSFPDQDIFTQPTLARTFTVLFGAAQTVTFTAVRSGKAHLNESASSFLKGNFLTWQPTTKYVTYYSPEWLTYFAVESCSIVLKAYFSGGETQLISLTSLSAGSCVTVNLQYAVVCGKLSNRRPMYYDVWAQGSSGARLTYIQRYMASAPQSPDESWYLFENSLGGLDSLRAYGSLDFAPEFEHQIAQTADGLQEYRIDTSRVYTRYTGYLNPAEAKWLQDLFSARQKYAYTHSGYYRIVFTSSDGAYSGADMPSSYSFSYRFAEDDPFLDIQRDEDLPENIEIALPDQEAFFLPPRLAEYPKLERNDDTLLLAQQPHTQEWGTLTFASIYEAILNDLIAKLDGLDITPCQGGGTGRDSFWKKVLEDESGLPLPVDKQYLTTIDTIGVRLPKDLIAAGSIICQSTNEAIPDTELPIASKTQLGLFMVGSGLSITEAGVLSVTGGSGDFNETKLQQYLEANKYYKSTSLLEGYVKADVYSPITSSDTILTAFGKLERHFDDYVTLSTDQTITGAKTFTRDIIGQADIICKATNEAVPDTELPIASATQLGLFKVGSGLAITADGVLSVDGSAGLTEVYWNQIKEKPTTLAGYGITDAYTKTQSDDRYLTKTGNAASASKLNPGCKIWGQAFTGESDVTGSLTNVGNIISSNSAFIISKSGIGSNYIINSLDNGQLNINAHNGGNILFGYRGTSGYQFYAGTGGGDSVGSSICHLDTGKLYLKVPLGIKTASPQAELHVIGDGLFTGDVIAKSTSEAIADAELPIASASTLGLIKVGSGFEITADGVLNNTGSGGLTEVYWDDIKGKPAAFAPSSHTHTVSQITDLVYNGKNTEIDNYDLNYAGRQIWFTEGSAPIPDIEVTNGGILAIRQAYGLSTQLLTSGSKLYTRFKSSTGSWTKWKTIAYTTDNVASASKLSPGCKIWGKTFTGENDITGDLTNVGNITSSNSAFIISKSGIGSNYIINSLDNGQLNINAHNGGNILFGYRGTSGYQFYAGTGGGDSVGSSICHLDTGKLYLKVPLGIKTASPQAELHVIGDGLFTGDVIAKSTSTAISDAELPIASKTQLGLIKVGSGFEITNGVLSATGGGVQGETGPQGQGVTYRWSGTSLQLGTIPVGGGVTTWGSPVNLKGQKGDRGATGPQGPKGDDGRDGTLSASTICYLPSAGTIFTTDNKLGVKLSGGNGIVGTRNGIRDNLYFNYISDKKYVLVDSSADLTCKGTIFYANLSQDSDLRLKNVLGELNGVLDIMSQIPVIEYQYKDDEDKINYYGFGAQSFIGRFRNIATLNNDHYTINTSGIVAIAFQGVKELYALQKQTTSEIDVLKQRIALLEAENQNLWNIINEKEAA